MIIGDLEQISTDFLPGPGSDARPFRRFILPISSVEADLFSGLDRVWELANRSEAEVLLVGISADPVHEPTLRRVLATLTAVLNHDGVEAQSKIFAGKDWASRFRAGIHEGDLVVCRGEEQTGFLNRPLSRILESELDIPLLILLSPSTHKPPRPAWLAKAAAWIGFLLMMGGFFLMQTQLLRLSGGLGTMLVAVSAVVEVILIGLWNNLFS